MLFSALMHSDSILTIGYKPAGEEDVDSRIAFIRVKDQAPLPRQPEVVIALGKTEPAPFKSDKDLKEDGALVWRLNLASGAKQVIKFQYDVARPKNWKLYQTSAPGVSR